MELKEVNKNNLEQNQNPKLSQYEQTQKELDELKEIIVENVEKVINRGINLNSLNQSCEYLEHHSQQFKKTGKRIRIKLLLKNKKYCLIIIIIMISIILMIIIGILVYFFLIKT